MLLSILVIILLGTGWILSALHIAFQKRKKNGKHRWPVYLASSFLIIGAAGFFGSALSAVGGLNWLPDRFEWPVGFASHVVRMENGGMAVPHTPSGRIQIYDANLRFLTGWHVNASGGAFKIRKLDNGLIEAVTARKKLRITYARDGRTLSTDAYAPAYYSSFPESSEKRYIPTSPLLFAFTNPFIAWIIAVLGILMLGIREKGIGFIFRKA